MATRTSTKPEGNWFKNRSGDLGAPCDDQCGTGGSRSHHPDTGAEITPDEPVQHRPDKEGWDRSNRLAHRPKVRRSADRPDGAHCGTTEGRGPLLSSEWPPELPELPAGTLQHCQGTVSLGLDLGTTEQKTSNPTALSVKGDIGGDVHLPSILWWKSADPRVTKAKVILVVKTLIRMGVRLKALGIDATMSGSMPRDS